MKESPNLILFDYPLRMLQTEVFLRIPQQLFLVLVLEFDVTGQSRVTANVLPVHCHRGLLAGQMLPGCSILNNPPSQTRNKGHLALCEMLTLERSHLPAAFTSGYNQRDCER